MARLHPMLATFKPTDADPWDRAKAAHLLNRAGFGGTSAEVEKAFKLGPIGAVDWLLDFPDLAAEEQSQTDVPNLSSIEGLPSNFREIAKTLAGKSAEERKQLKLKFLASNRQTVMATASWWLRRMVEGPYPLQEKLTLFWHGHFTTSAKDERSASLMWNQNELLRRQAAGNFGTFVKKISRDPAMLDYLNNSQNRKAHPNENYARELMELFTLGIGNYTEDDIKQVARAFTGWAHDGDDFVYRKFDHDDGEKNVFGARGNFDGDDVVDLILNQTACPTYIAGRLYHYFVTDDLEETLRSSLGEVFREARYEIRPLLRTLFSSKAFYQANVIGAQIKSPIQLLVGTVRLLDRPMPPVNQINGMLNQMGQAPLYPPNVKGWPGGHTWISTSTLFVRYNTCLWLTGAESSVALGANLKGAGANRNARPLGFDPPGANAVESAVDTWVDRLVQRPIDPAKRQTLIQSMKGRATESAIRSMIQLIVSMPEYQLC